MDLDTLSLAILGPAFLAGLLVAATHVPLGFQVLRRGIVFIDLAVAQVAALGVIAADFLGLDAHGWAAQGAAFSAAMGGAWLLTWSERCWPEVQEALIGALFVVAASAGMLLLTRDPHGGEHLKDLLAGQILWVSYTQLLPVAALTALVGGLWLGRGERLGRTGFYLLFACAVTVSVQLVGVYLVFATLILPALASRHYLGRVRLAAGYALAAAGYGAGLALSALLDLPSGAVVVLALAGGGILLYVLGPRAGVSAGTGR